MDFGLGLHPESAASWMSKSEQFTSLISFLTSKMRRVIHQPPRVVTGVELTGDSIGETLSLVSNA